MKRVIVAIFLVLKMGAVLAQESACSFFISSSGLSQNWQHVEGEARINLTGSHFLAQLFGDKSDSQPTHNLKGFIKSNRVFATLVNLHSDAGTEEIAGLYIKETDPHSGKPPKIFESLVAHNGRVAVGIKCYGLIQSLTNYSNGAR